MRRYVSSVLMWAAVFSLAVPAFNWLVDPYDIWDSGRLTGLRLRKPEAHVEGYVIQLHRAFSSPIHVGIIGTSRAGVGVDHRHPGLGSGRRFNLATPMQSVEESELLVQRMAAAGSLRSLVWGLDVVAFSCAQYIPRVLRKEHFTLHSDLRLLVVLETVKDSISTLLRQNAQLPAELPGGALILVNFKERMRGKGHRVLARRSEQQYLEVYRRPFSLNCQEKDSVRPLERYRTLLRTAHLHGIDFRLFISPSHARLWETLMVSGLWPTWEEWKRELVRLNIEEAQKAGKKPFDLWDFSGYNSLTTEPLPAQGDVETEMRWHWESSHYKKELGDLVIDRIFGHQHPGRDVPGDFGVLLEPENLESHLNRIRDDRQRWVARFPNDAQEIMAAAEKIRRGRRQSGDSRTLLGALKAVIQ